MSASSRDCLTALPPELIHLICDYLLPTHDPDRAFHHYPTNTTTITPYPPKYSHDLDHFAATCHSLRSLVNSWAKGFLRRHKGIFRLSEAELQRQEARRKGTSSTLPVNYLRNNSKRGTKFAVLTWLTQHCAFCGRKSVRSAIFMSGLRCCDECDKREWPWKVTKTNAMKDFDLKEHQLLPHKTPPSGRNLNALLGIPTLWYGTYMSMNGPTTMFLQQDVERLAKLVHGDLKAHLAQRERDREERKVRRQGRVDRAARSEAGRARKTEAEGGEVIDLVGEEDDTQATGDGTSHQWMQQPVIIIHDD